MYMRRNANKIEAASEYLENISFLNSTPDEERGFEGDDGEGTHNDVVEEGEGPVQVQARE